jgi:hypothetical protein
MRRAIVGLARLEAPVTHPSPRSPILLLGLLPVLSCGGEKGVTVFHAPPAVSITQPSEDSSFTEDQTVSFSGLVDDDVDGAANLALTWSSNLDGLLDDAPADSSGYTAFATADLSAGTHVITLQATNSNAESAEDYVTVTISAVEQAPTITVRSPAGSDYGVEGQPFDFEVRVSDAQDAAADLVVWFESDLDGVFCEPVPEDDGTAACLVALSAGEHNLSFGVEDSGGNLATAELFFLVEAADEHDDDLDGYTEAEGDCDDTDPSVRPGGTEVGNGVDDDCDGDVDEGTVYFDDDGDCACEEDSCEGSVEALCDEVVGGDCDDADPDVGPLADELCNSVDDDCDGVADEDDALDVATWYADADGDLYGDAASTAEACTAPSGHVANASDCDDSDAAVSPAATETCNGVDDDCDGTADESSASDAPTWYKDADADGYGAAASSTRACTQPSGYVADATDCNDANAAISPAATELCDSADNDCDGSTDEADAADAPTWYVDGDGDGYGTSSSTRVQCSAPAGYVASSTDCDDGAAAVSPAATETCNSVDDDCDGSTDEGVTTTYYRDADGDGYGSSSTTSAACSAPTGYVSNSSDCDDTDATLSPLTVWYRDSDSDGYGDASVTKTQCAKPSGYTDDDSDCNDASASAYPGATESCDGIDNDCDGSTDERNASGCSTWYYDSDGDGYGADSVSGRCYCEATGYYTATNNTDCYDSNTNANPGASAYYSADRGDGSYDYNCDGTESKRYTDNYSCTGAVYVCVDYTNGWSSSSDPACGSSGNWRTGCSASLTSCSYSSTAARTQTCR